MDAAQHQRLSELFLAALEVDTANRATWVLNACDDDREVQDQLGQLLAAHVRSAGLLDHTPVFDVGLDLIAREPTAHPFIYPGGHRVGKYRLLREIGQGGMGVVFEACHEEVPGGKSVAVKILKRGMDTEAIVCRFQTEYRILASLEHPYIARFYDGGTTSDGLPYFVMELVSGLPIDEFCRQNKVSISDQLRLFQKVCDAVQYAHRHLVVHRDIKPSNILVLADGTPKLLDFGIARVLQAEDQSSAITLPPPGLTRTNQRFLTPLYASPEQIRGEAVTTASDVYALGVLLFQLLTGQFPYPIQKASVVEIQRLVCDSEPLKPSQALPVTLSEYRQRKRRLMGDLDNIVMLALSKEPAARYSSVEQFSEDIARFLHGRPVRARYPSLGYRAGKFFKRYAVQIVATTCISLSLVSGTGIAFWQARQAEIQRQVSLARTQDTRALASKLVFHFHDEIEKLPGSTPARRELVQEAVTYLDRLSRESQDDVSLKTELALAYRKIGDVQGRPFVANLGDTTGALQNYQKSFVLLTQLATAQPVNVSIQLELATSYERLGEILALQGESAIARQCLQQSQTILERLVNQSPSPVNAQRLLANSYARSGQELRAQQDWVTAFNYFQKALALRKQLAAQNPADPQLRRGLANSYMGLSLTFEAIGDLEWKRTGTATWSKELYQSALEFSQFLVHQSFEEVQSAPLAQGRAHREYAGCLLHQGTLQLKRGDLRQATETLEHARSGFQKLLVADPENTEYKILMALTLRWLGTAFLKTNQIVKASQSLTDSLNLINILVAKDFENLLIRQIQADANETMALVAHDTGHLDRAFSYAQAGYQIRKNSSAIHPANHQVRMEQLQSLGILAQMTTDSKPMDVKTQLDQLQVQESELAEYAWILLTPRPAGFQRPEQAVQYAQRACEVSGGTSLTGWYALTAASLASGNEAQAEQSARQFVQRLPGIGESKRESVIQTVLGQLRVAVSTPQSHPRQSSK
ncbi:MAG: protein kinase [Acidobacteria bacterium]|nr:protein kinase [Acidobacteriota bacterium]